MAIKYSSWLGIRSGLRGYGEGLLNAVGGAGGGSIFDSLLCDLPAFRHFETSFDVQKLCFFLLYKRCRWGRIKNVFGTSFD